MRRSAEWRLVTAFLPAPLFAPAVVAGLLTLAAKALTAERTEPAPTTDEQFERLFREVTTMANTSKIVVFVDELDRRPAHEVVGTLDVLRSFLGQELCLFVVAADQQVLEQALRRRLPQATPENATNPYYSAGGSYLDKVLGSRHHPRGIQRLVFVAAEAMHWTREAGASSPASGALSQRTNAEERPWVIYRVAHRCCFARL